MTVPFYMTLHQKGVAIGVNMNHVRWMYPNNNRDLAAGTVLIFGDIPTAYLIVDESLEYIQNHRGWAQ